MANSCSRVHLETKRKFSILTANFSHKEAQKLKNQRDLSFVYLLVANKTYFTRTNGMSRIRDAPTCRRSTFPFWSLVNQTTDPSATK